MEGHVTERKQSVVGSPSLLDVEQLSHKTRSPSPEDIGVRKPKGTSPKEIPAINIGRHRTQSESQSYADTEVHITKYVYTITQNNYQTLKVEELFAMLRETEALEEQGDILQYLVDTKGLDFNTGMLEHGRVVTVRDLLKGLYEKACQQKLWGLVRHTAGMLGKRVEDLAKAVTDLLVRQKQVIII